MSATSFNVSTAALGQLALLLQPGEPGRGEVLVRLRTGSGEPPLVRLGRDFQLDGDLAERLAAIEGISHISLTAGRGDSHLRLVA